MRMKILVQSGNSNSEADEQEEMSKFEAPSAILTENFVVKGNKWWF